MDTYSREINQKGTSVMGFRHIFLSRNDALCPLLQGQKVAHCGFWQRGKTVAKSRSKEGNGTLKEGERRI